MMSDTAEFDPADREAFEAAGGRVNLDMEPEDALKLMLGTDLRQVDPDEEQA